MVYIRVEADLLLPDTLIQLCFMINPKPYSIISRKVLLFILFVLSSFFSTSFQLKAQVSSSKVILISLDGTPGYLVDKYLSEGVLPEDGAFARMKRNGIYAKRVYPINVASTGPSHISIFTGASPSKTGIVGNNFRTAEQQWNTPFASAFRSSLPIETIFQSAMRQGKKVMTLGAVGVDNLSVDRRSDFMYMYPSISGPSLILDLEITDTTVNSNSKVYRKLSINPKSPSQPFLEISGISKTRLHFYLQDAVYTDNGSLKNFEQIIIDSDLNIDNGFLASIKHKEWERIGFTSSNKYYNVSFKVLNSDILLGKFRLFMNSPAEIYGYPNSFLKKIQDDCGFWPGEPENRKQTIGLISEEIWFEQIEKLAKYYRDMIVSGIKAGNWDLLFGYFSTLDDVQHRYTLTNSRQIDFKEENGNRPNRYAAYIKKWFQVIDNYLLDIMNAAPPETNFIIFSDHGMIPIHSTLLLNNYLQREGFSFQDSELASVSSGNSAHIYINRDKISYVNYPEYLGRLKKSLASLKDTITGKPIFEVVANLDEQKKLGLYYNGRSGDLFVSCKPGYSISDRFIPSLPNIVQNTFDYKLFQDKSQALKTFLSNGTMNETGRAVHGNLANIREGQPIFYSMGPDIPKSKIRRIHSLQIAPTIADILGIEKPKSFEKNSLLKE